MDAAEVKRLLAAEGAVASGIAPACPVDPADMDAYARWIADGRHGDMKYLEKYPDIRADPAQLLPGARAVIVAAFSYNNDARGPLRWARYALGRDYHEEVRERLSRVAADIEACGAQCRVAVDTAPLRERYWALKAGIGFRGLNGLVIIPGAGSWTVLGEIITTLQLRPDTPSAGLCGGCRRCVTACPGHALDGRGGMDARRCRSYLTIECRDPDGLPPLEDGRVYGCDICQEVCPHNAGAPLSAIPAFTPRRTILALGRQEILHMTQDDFSRIFSHSAIKRAKLSGLQRNAGMLAPAQPGQRDTRLDTELTGDTADGLT